MAVGGVGVDFIRPDGGDDRGVGVEDDAGLGIEAGSVGGVAFGFDAVVDEAVTVAVGVVGGEESVGDSFGGFSCERVDGDDFPGDEAGGGVEGGGEVYEVADGVAEVEAGGVVLESVGDGDGGATEAEVA